MKNLKLIEDKLCPWNIYRRESR